MSFELKSAVEDVLERLETPPSALDFRFVEDGASGGVISAGVADAEAPGVESDLSPEDSMDSSGWTLFALLGGDWPLFSATDCKMAAAAAEPGGGVEFRFNRAFL